MSKTMEVITDAPSHREMEHRLNTLQTSLSMVERSITKFKNLIEDCRMLEEEVRHIEEDEVHLEEEIHQEEEEEIRQEEEGGGGSPTSRWPKRKSMVISSPLAPMERPIPRAPSIGLCWRCCLPRGGRSPHAASTPT